MKMDLKHEFIKNSRAIIKNSARLQQSNFDIYFVGTNTVALVGRVGSGKDWLTSRVLSKMVCGSKNGGEMHVTPNEVGSDWTCTLYDIGTLHVLTRQRIVHKQIYDALVGEVVES